MSTPSQNSQGPLNVNQNDALNDQIKSLCLELSEYIVSLKKPEIKKTISKDTFKILLIIKFFLDSPSTNEVYRAQTHISNMLSKSDTESTVEKETLEKTQLLLDKIYDLLEIQSENLKKSQEQARNKLIDDSINERLACISLKTPITKSSEFKFTNSNAANTSTPNDGKAEIKNEQPDNSNYVPIISEAFLREKNLKSNNESEFNFTEEEKNIIKYLNKCDYNRKMSFIKHLGCEQRR